MRRRTCAAQCANQTERKDAREVGKSASRQTESFLPTRQRWPSFSPGSPAHRTASAFVHQIVPGQNEERIVPHLLCSGLPERLRT